METEHQILHRKPGLIERDLGDAVVIMDPDGNDLHTVQGTALFLWRLIDGHRTLGALADALTAEYEVDRNRALTDCQAFAVTLGTKGLLKP